MMIRGGVAECRFRALNVNSDPALVVLVKKQLVGGRKCDFFKKCLRGRLVCGLRPVGILVMFTEIFVSVFFVCHRFID